MLVVLLCHILVLYGYISSISLRPCFFSLYPKFSFFSIWKSCSKFFRTNFELKKNSLHLKSLIFFFQSSSTLSLVLPRFAFKKPIFWSTSRVNELAIFWTWFGIGQRHPTDQQQSHSWDFSLKMGWGKNSPILLIMMKRYYWFFEINFR